MTISHQRTKDAFDLRPTRTSDVAHNTQSEDGAWLVVTGTCSTPTAEFKVRCTPPEYPDFVRVLGPPLEEDWDLEPSFDDRPFEVVRLDADAKPLDRVRTA